MGWKALAIFATDRPGYFGSKPLHDTSAAEEVRARLGLADHVAVGEEDFDVALCTRGGNCCGPPQAHRTTA